MPVARKRNNYARGGLSALFLVVACYGYFCYQRYEEECRPLPPGQHVFWVHDSIPFGVGALIHRGLNSLGFPVKFS